MTVWLRVQEDADHEKKWINAVTELFRDKGISDEKLFLIVCNGVILCVRVA